MTALVAAVLSAGYGPVSLLETGWILLGLVCARDALCLFVDARATLAAALLPPADEVGRLMAVVDLRGAAQAILVQVCFLGMGVLGALRPAPPPAGSDAEALAGLVSLVLLVVVQVSNAVAAHERRRYSRRIDAALRARMDAQA